MTTSVQSKIGLFIAAALLAACASKPPNLQQLPATAEATTELESTQRRLAEARENGLDIISPKSYERARENFADAQEALAKGKSKEKIMKSISYSRGWLEEAEARGRITEAAGKGLVDARRGALNSNAQNLYPKEFQKIEDRTRKLTQDAENGDMADLTKQNDALVATYRNLEVSAVTKKNIGDAQMNLVAAKKNEAAKFSPRTLEATEAKLNQAAELIKQNPRDSQTIARVSAEATEQTKFLLTVNEKTKAGNTEDLVLQSEGQKRAITGLASGLEGTKETLEGAKAELAGTEAELAQKNAALRTAEELRKNLKPNEAEVFVENNAVKVRLKGVQFGSNSSVINQRSASLLEKVDRVLGTVGASSIVVEGHTDSVGSPETNQEISEKRAQAVQNYMVNKGVISSNQIQAVGRGEDSPISDNKTSRGRSENRRIDLLIEPKIE